MHARKLSLNKETIRTLTDAKSVAGGYTTINETDQYCVPSGPHACLPIPTTPATCPGGPESMDTCYTR